MAPPSRAGRDYDDDDDDYMPDSQDEDTVDTDEELDHEHVTDETSVHEGPPTEMNLIQIMRSV